jgi:hypothetical protein
MPSPSKSAAQAVPPPPPQRPSLLLSVIIPSTATVGDLVRAVDEQLRTRYRIRAQEVADPGGDACANGASGSVDATTTAGVMSATRAGQDLLNAMGGEGKVGEPPAAPAAAALDVEACLARTWGEYVLQPAFADYAVDHSRRFLSECHILPLTHTPAVTETERAADGIADGDDEDDELKCCSRASSSVATGSHHAEAGAHTHRTTTAQSNPAVDGDASPASPGVIAAAPLREVLGPFPYPPLVLMLSPFAARLDVVTQVAEPTTRAQIEAEQAAFVQRVVVPMVQRMRAFAHGAYFMSRAEITARSTLALAARQGLLGARVATLVREERESRVVLEASEVAARRVLLATHRAVLLYVQNATALAAACREAIDDDGYMWQQQLKRMRERERVADAAAALMTAMDVALISFDTAAGEWYTVSRLRAEALAPVLAYVNPSAAPPRFVPIAMHPESVRPLPGGATAPGAAECIHQRRLQVGRERHREMHSAVPDVANRAVISGDWCSCSRVPPPGQKQWIPAPLRSHTPAADGDDAACTSLAAHNV